MELEEAKEIIKNSWLFDSANENIGLKEALSTALQEIDRLQKENEELKKRFRRYEDVDKENEKYRKVIDNAQKDSISKDKIKELIIKKKQQIQENNKQIEECRKTIMEEQELKKLQLFTLNKNNDLLELEIVDLFELLKEE